MRDERLIYVLTDRKECLWYVVVVVVVVFFFCVGVFFEVGCYLFFCFCFFLF